MQTLSLTPSFRQHMIFLFWYLLYGRERLLNMIWTSDTSMTGSLTKDDSLHPTHPKPYLYSWLTSARNLVYLRTQAWQSLSGIASVL